MMTCLEVMPSRTPFSSALSPEAAAVAAVAEAALGLESLPHAASRLGMSSAPAPSPVFLSSFRRVRSGASSRSSRSVGRSMDPLLHSMDPKSSRWGSSPADEPNCVAYGCDLLNFGYILWVNTPPPPVLVTGDIITMDPGRPRVEAVAIAAGRVVATGSKADAAAALPAGTPALALPGTVVPGML